MDKNRNRFGFAPMATAFSLVACYGTLVTVALLGALGVSIAVNQAVWAGAIVLFAGFALVAIFLRWWTHRRHLSITLAALGFLLIAYAMFVSYSPIIELVGFLLLCAGTIIDWRVWRGQSRN